MLLRLRKGLCFAGALPAILLLVSTTTSCRKRSTHRSDPLPPPHAVSTSRPPETAKTAPEDDKSAGSQMSEPERKAAARAAFADGVELQDRSDCVGAIPRFETAQRLFDAPTHLLHIAQCQAQMGRLVEAQESYATLAHMTLDAKAPPPFRVAKETGRAELARLSPRVPTLRVQTNPPLTTLKNVVVTVNGTQMPADLIGVARPLNPGRYHVTVTASPNRSGAGDMDLKEGDAKSLDVRLSP